MPKSTIAQRHKSAATRFDGPPSPQAVTTAPPAQMLPRELVAAFRVGDYEVGQGFCPRLWGHPGIRY